MSPRPVLPTLERAPDGRLVILTDAPITRPYYSVLPLRDALVEMGNEIIPQPGADDGFYDRPDGPICDLAKPILAADWAMLEERFVIPPRIGLALPNLIRDSYNWVDIRGGVRVDGAHRGSGRR